MAAERIRIEVAYAGPERQVLIEVAMAPDATVREAIERSGILAQFPQIDPNACRTGIFGRPSVLETELENGDRVEIYRPLIADPKQARRARALQARDGV